MYSIFFYFTVDHSNGIQFFFIFLKKWICKLKQHENEIWLWNVKKVTRLVMLAFSSKVDSLGYMNSLSLLLLWNPWTSAGLKRGSHYSPPSAKTWCDLSMESRKGCTIIQRPLATKIISFLSYSMGSRNGFDYYINQIHFCVCDIILK